MPYMLLLLYLQLRQTISCVPSHFLRLLEECKMYFVCVRVSLFTWRVTRVRLNNRVLESVRENPIARPMVLAKWKMPHLSCPLNVNYGREKRKRGVYLRAVSTTRFAWETRTHCNRAFSCTHYSCSIIYVSLNFSTTGKRRRRPRVL